MELKSGSHIHLMGICGTAMASLAGMLKEKSFKITGSDQNPYPPMSTQLEKMGIEIMKGYRAENLNIGPDYVIVGNVMTRDYEESQALLRSKIAYGSLPKTIGNCIIEDRESFVVCGTHGKTTTTSMLAWLAHSIDLKPGFMIGGIPLNFDKSFRLPEGDLFIIEGDEYDSAFFDKVPKFIHYKPKNVILSSIEFDHADIYKDLEDVISAFSMLNQYQDPKGILIFRGNDKNIEKVVKHSPVLSKFSYDWQGADYTVDSILYQPNYSSFNVQFRGEDLGTFQIPQYGSYNVLNALSCIAMAHQKKWNLENLRKSFLEFKGVKRRQELIGKPNGIFVIEDFAHHPTAVKLTVEAVKQRFPQNKVFAVFEPRSATSRRKVFQEDYSKAFGEADKIFIREALNQSNISEENRFSSKALVSSLKANHKDAVLFHDIASCVEALKQETKPGDAVLLMSNGSFDGIYGEVLKHLEFSS